MGGAIRYFGLYRFALHMNTDPARTALEIHRCSKVDWTKMGFEDRVVSYDSENADIFDLKQDVVLADK